MTALQYFQSQAGNSLGDFITAVLKIDNERDARRFYQGAVKSMERYQKHNQPQEVVKANIGFAYGEGMPPDRISMWVRVCGSYSPGLRPDRAERRGSV